LLEGATVVILPRFELDAFLRAVQDYGVTRAEVVPPIILALASSEIVDDYDLSSLRVLTVAAAPLSADRARACARRIGCRVKQGYGMTELGGGTHVAPDDGPDQPDSIGPALPGVECRVIDLDTSTDLGPDAPGELLIRSPGTMLGTYWRHCHARRERLVPRRRSHQGTDQVQGFPGRARRARGDSLGAPSGRGRGSGAQPG